MKYDAVISLGSFCQVGGALWLYGLKNINSPLDNFGIKRWQSITEILNSRFEHYWRLENMGFGKVVKEYSAVCGPETPLRKVYDNKYDLVSNHNFMESENPEGNEFATYDQFREKLAFLEEVFLKQCDQYENIRFVLKAMNWPNPKETSVEPSDIADLLAALADLRGGKPFDLSIAVPLKRYESIRNWIAESGITNVIVSSWDIEFNDQKHEEWDALLADIELDPDYYWQLISRIIGNTDIDLRTVNNF